MEPALLDKIKELATGKRERIVTAESLTAGMISAELARVSGASNFLNGGFFVYQDEVKTAFLGVPPAMLKEFSAVSHQVAEAMARGALEKTGPNVLGDKASTISVAVTGYASAPGDLAPASDTGLVYIGIGRRFNGAADSEIKVYEHRFSGDRNAVRQATTDQALGYLLETLKR